jgi:hypothetical protein
MEIPKQLVPIVTEKGKNCMVLVAMPKIAHAQCVVAPDILFVRDVKVQEIAVFVVVQEKLDKNLLIIF